jgi:CHAT domain-containing protein
MESEMDCDNTPTYCRLKHTRDEASAIQSTFPAGRTRLALDTDANRQLATAAAMDQYAYLHVATHGIFNSNEPSLSGLLLSRVDRQGRATDGLLQLGDIFNLRLNSDLVVLSACETGRGTEIKGEGLVGMTRGFLYAGSQRVVASLWKVDDAATATFMQQFYHNLITEKQSPSQALRSTQLFMQSHKTWASPFYWSAFVLQGEW